MNRTNCEDGRFTDEILQFPNENEICQGYESTYFATFTLILVFRFCVVFHSIRTAVKVKRMRENTASPARLRDSRRGFSWNTTSEIFFTTSIAIAIFGIYPFVDSVSTSNGVTQAIYSICVMSFMVSTIFSSLKLVHLSKRIVPKISQVKGIKYQLSTGNSSNNTLSANDTDPNTEIGRLERERAYEFENLDKIRGNRTLIALSVLVAVSAFCMQLFLVPLSIAGPTIEVRQIYLRIGLFFQGTFFTGSVGIIAWQIHRVVKYISKTKKNLKKAFNGTDSGQSNSDGSRKMDQVVKRMKVNAIVTVVMSSAAALLPLLYGIGVLKYRYELFAITLLASSFTTLSATLMFSNRGKGKGKGKGKGRDPGTGKVEEKMSTHTSSATRKELGISYSTKSSPLKETQEKRLSVPNNVE